MYVYTLQSLKDPSRKYIGRTSNLRQRLSYHNAGKSTHTAKYTPWKVITATWFSDKDKAFKYERYLKHGSGHAFAKRHLY